MAALWLCLILLLLAGVTFSLTATQIDLLYLAKFGPLMTPAVAAIAALIAVTAIIMQLRIARKRAAIDIFIKSEMDLGLVQAYDDYLAAKEALRAFPSESDMELFRTGAATKRHYLAIRRFLNIHELIAVGIHNDVLDKRVCYEYWGDVFVSACKDARRVIDHAKTKESGGSEHTYSDLLRLNSSWARGVA